MESLSEVTRRRAEIRRELEELEVEENRLLAESGDARLAEELHSVMCKDNHTDQCGWHYESIQGKPDWIGYAHARWLSKARQAMMELPDLPADEIIRVVSALK